MKILVSVYGLLVTLLKHNFNKGKILIYQDLIQINTNHQINPKEQSQSINIVDLRSKESLKTVYTDNHSTMLLL